MNLRGKMSWTITLMCLVGVITAQDKKEESKRPSGLGVRQARVERMMEDVERKFKELSQTLQEAEPERAKRLIETLHQSKEMLIQKRMSQIAGMLDGQKLETATEEQKEILTDIRQLIQLLLDEQDKDTKDEADRLEKWRQSLKKIIEEQKEQMREADKIANKDDTLDDLDSQIRAVEDLIEKQTKVNEDMKKARKEGVQAYRPVADAQHEVRKETEKVAEAIGRAAGQETPSSGAEGDPKEGKEGAGKEGSSKEGESKEGAGKKGESKEGSGKEGESKEGSEGSPSSSGAESQSASQSGSKPSEPGQQKLQQATKKQQSAENNLQEGKGKSAQGDGEKALEDLKAALDDLKKEQRRIASLPPEAFDKMADKQDKTQQKTASLDKEMDEAAKKAGGEGSGSSGSQGGKKTPGQKQIQQAQKNMKQASGDLRKQDPEGAARQQDEAVRQLEKALKEIEERLAQLREETQEEKLARLEARFVEMLARQEVVTAETRVLDKKKQDDGNLRRADRLAIAKLALEERELSAMAQEALEILFEDGTSVVFPSIVEGLRDDLTSVANMLEGQKTGDYTQYLQSEVETTLKELIEALKKQQKQGGGGGGGGGNCEPPLLPNSAELKLLRAAQLRVNRRTKAFDANRSEGTLDELMKKEVSDIGLRQLDIAIMTEQIIERSMNVPLQ